MSDPEFQKYFNHLPEPPQFARGQIRLPPFFRINHPYTKWMLNVMRTSATFRLAVMIRERPELFEQIYQIPDIGGYLNGTLHDTTSMFNNRAVLYLNPLCLAIYTKNEKALDVILKSGVNHPQQFSYATDVHRKGKDYAGDILQILPICVAIRREFFDVIPALNKCVCATIDLSTFCFNPVAAISLQYESRESIRLQAYRDSLQYAAEVLRFRPSFPFARLLETIVMQCSSFYDPDYLAEDANGQKVSLFRRIARMAYYEDQDCRVCYHLLASLDCLIRYKYTRPFSPSPDTINGLQNRVTSSDPYIIDQDASVALLFALYNRLHFRFKNGPLDYLGEVIYKTMVNIGWMNSFKLLTVSNVLEIFGSVPENISLSHEALVIVKKHLNIMNDFHKDKQVRIFEKADIITESGTTKRTPTANQDADNLLHARPRSQNGPPRIRNNLSHREPSPRPSQYPPSITEHTIHDLTSKELSAESFEDSLLPRTQKIDTNSPAENLIDLSSNDDTVYLNNIPTDFVECGTNTNTCESISLPNAANHRHPQIGDVEEISWDFRNTYSNSQGGNIHSGVLDSDMEFTQDELTIPKNIFGANCSLNNNACAVGIQTETDSPTMSANKSVQTQRNSRAVNKCIRPVTPHKEVKIREKVEDKISRAREVSWERQAYSRHNSNTVMGGTEPSNPRKIGEYRGSQLCPPDSLYFRRSVSENRKQNSRFSGEHSSKCM